MKRSNGNGCYIYIYKARVKIRWMYRVRGWVLGICITHILGLISHRVMKSGGVIGWLCWVRCDTFLILYLSFLC